VKAVSKNVYDGRSEILYRPLFADSMQRKNADNFVRTMLAYFGVDGLRQAPETANPFRVGEPFAVELEVETTDYAIFKPKGALVLRSASISSTRSNSSSSSKRTPQYESDSRRDAFPGNL
jgi:hypothetical protein